ncbi:MAG: phosphoribosyltransferase [Acidimicrobiia bacterium]
MRYRHRQHAGQVLAEALQGLHLASPAVLGLPRGGVPVAAEVAVALSAPLDVLVVRKLGLPEQPELGLGAIAEGGITVLNDDLVKRTGVAAEVLARVHEREEGELARRAQTYRGRRERVSVAGRTAVVVDDGLATGYTARAAVRAARELGAAGVILAVPVGAPETVADLAEVADGVVCPLQPRRLWAVGQWYDDFQQTPDAEVVELLEAARRRVADG